MQGGNVDIEESESDTDGGEVNNNEDPPDIDGEEDNNNEGPPDREEHDGGMEREDQNEEEVVNQVIRPTIPPPLPSGVQHRGQDQQQFGGQVQGELLQTRVRPAVTGPERLLGDDDVDADGWAVIDSVGAWDCMLVKFAMLQEVPSQQCSGGAGLGEAGHNVAGGCGEEEHWRGVMKRRRSFSGEQLLT